MCPPKYFITVATAKNLPPRPKIDATMNVGILIPKSPPAIVNTLYGIGVNAATKIAKNALSAKSFCTVTICVSR